MGCRFDDGGRSARRIAALEDARADKDAFGAKLHHQRRVGRGGNAAGGEQHDWQSTLARDLSYELVWCAWIQGFRLVHQLLVAERAEATNVRGDRADVADRVDDVAGAGV